MGMTGLLLLAAAATTQPVEIRFEGIVGDKTFQCGESYAGIGKPAASIRPTDFRFYVSQVALIDERGRAVPVALDQDGLWQYRNAALLDFEDGSGPCRGGNSGVNGSIKGKVPAGRYTGMRFDIGLPADLNHADATTAPSPLNFTAMFWSWQAGYRFLKVDLESAGMGGAMNAMPGMRQTGFAVHVGSTDCPGSSSTQAPPAPCARPNRITVQFDRFDPSRDLVVADIAAMLADTDVGHNTPNTAPGCMAGQDDPDCKGIFAAFGLPFQQEAVPTQSVFRKK